MYKDKTYKADGTVLKTVPMFRDTLDPTAHRVIDDFSDVVTAVIRPNSSARANLPRDIARDIAALSHLMTSEKGERRLSYMNDSKMLTAYAYYFMHWNLVRLTTLLGGALNSIINTVQDGSVIIDIGSGPAVFAVALWLAAPALRDKKIRFYMVDISHSALSLGEKLFLEVVKRCPAPSGECNWQLVLVKGSLGVSIRQKAQLVVSCNMFNEIDGYKKRATALLQYAAASSTIIMVEPGAPEFGCSISSARDSFIKKGLTVTSPCTHCASCPMSGVGAHHGSSVKWCNFAFSVEKGAVRLGSAREGLYEDGSRNNVISEVVIHAPKKLLKLSARANLLKTRCVISYIVAQQCGGKKKEGEALKSQKEPKECSAKDSSDNLKKRDEKLSRVKDFRVTSDIISLPWGESGYYACSEGELFLLLDAGGLVLHNGDVVTVKMSKRKVFGRDKKTGAIIVRVDATRR